MKSLFLVVIFSLCMFCAQSQTIDCDKVRTGIFKSILVMEKDTMVTMIYREKDKQVEVNEARGIRMEFVVKWTSPCVYELSKPRIIKGEVPGVSDDQVLYVKITDVNKAGYSAEISSNFFDGRMNLDFLINK